MTSRKKFRWPLILLITGILLCIGLVWKSRSSCTGISCLGFGGASDFHVAELYEDKGDTWRGMLARGNERVRLEVIRGVGRVTADEFTRVRMVSIIGLYDTALSPYPGAVSATVRCETQFVPVRRTLTTRDGEIVTYFSAYLNNRMQYGVCVESQVSYRVVSGFLYCAKSQAWMQVERIAPGADGGFDGLVDFFRDVTCR